MTRGRVLASLFIIAVSTSPTATRAQPSADAERLPYPPADRVEAVDVFHDVAVADPYRWLEDLGSAKTREWIKAQDDLTRKVLEGEAYRTIRQRIDRLANVRRYTTPIRRGDRWFFFETDANGTSGRVLMMREGRSAAPRPLVDLRGRAGADSLSRVLAPSPDGRQVAYGVSLEGTRWLQLRLADPATGQSARETLDSLHSSMGTIAWTPDARSFYYVRFDPPQGSRLTAAVTGAAVMRHVLGTPQTRDEKVFQLADAPGRLYMPSVSDDGQWLIVASSIGASTDQEVWVRDLRTPSARLEELFPGTRGQFTFLGGRDNRFWFQTSVDAPRQRVVRVDPRHPERARWQEIVPQPDPVESIAYVNMIAERLIVFSTRDAAPRVRIHGLAGALEREVPLPSLGTVWGPSASSVGFAGRPADREAYYVVTGVADPGSVYQLDPQTGRTEVFLRPSFGFDPKDFVGRQVFYPSKDGTRIPMFIAHHKDVPPDGARAAFMYGYGAFGWAAFPWFQPQVLAWMEAGGVYAIPCLRGGGEYGDRWHEAAIREKKQTSVDDYVAAAEWLVANKYAAPGKLVANGGSVSGVVAAAAVVQRPALFGAAVIDIPALDMVRYDRHTGAASWIPEFGSTASPVEFKALRALSPYHNLDSSVCYPPMLVLAGENDDIAVPSHAYKFIAALQASQRCASPALLQVAWGAGHTFGSSNDTSADTWARQLAFVSFAMLRPSDTRLRR